MSVEMAAQCSLVIKTRNRMQRKSKTSLCHSNPLCAWILVITHSTLSTVTQDIGQVETVKERAIEMVGKHISEQRMADRLRIFSGEKS